MDLSVRHKGYPVLGGTTAGIGLAAARSLTEDGTAIVWSAVIPNVAGRPKRPSNTSAGSMACRTVEAALPHLAATKRTIVTTAVYSIRSPEIARLPFADFKSRVRRQGEPDVRRRGLAMANLLLSVMGAFAEFERALILERQREGIAAAKACGAYTGRKPASPPSSRSSCARARPPANEKLHSTSNSASAAKPSTPTRVRGSIRVRQA